MNWDVQRSTFINKIVIIMKAILKYYAVALFVLLASINSYPQDQIINLSNGKKVVLHADHTWNYYEDISYKFDFSNLRDNKIPSFLRQGISVNKNALKIAVEMYLQGWRYTMPVPKSNQARWGNYDGRTTWWMGYWYNKKTHRYSESTPEKQSNGYYYGDDQNQKGYWRRGGSPSYPTKIEWLLSSYGGIKPY
jgi:hypothetical protein